MFRSTPVASYKLAFNPAAKARANWGLKGVGLYSSTGVYTKAGQSAVAWTAGMGIAWIYCSAIMTNKEANMFVHAGGGPVPFPLSAYGIPEDWKEKPWEYSFGPGEGFENGPPTMRPVPGAIQHGISVWDAEH